MFLNRAMTFKCALEFSLEHNNSDRVLKILSSTNSLFIPLWAAVAAKKLRERVEIDAVGDLKRTSTHTIISICEMKNRDPGESRFAGTMVRFKLNTLEVFPHRWAERASVPDSLVVNFIHGCNTDYDVE